jgi:hypothetical protein
MAELHVQRKRSSYLWFWLLLIILLAAAATYYYMHYYQKNNLGNTTKSTGIGLVKPHLFQYSNCHEI